MDESIRNAERLIEAANSALARMTSDASLDELGFGVRGDERKRAAKSRLADREESSFADKAFSTRDKIWEDLFGPDNLPAALRSGVSQTSNDAKIEEINSRIETYRQELLERESLKAREEAAATVVKAPSETNVSQKSVPRAKPPVTRLAEDLKSKLLQTQDIVDRGIQTARELSETVENLRGRTNRCEKCEEGVSKSRSSEKLPESRGSVKRCRRCNSEMSGKRSGREKAPVEKNVSVTKVRRRDASPEPERSHRKLNVQRLPSLRIHGDLSCQRIPGVDIPPGKSERVSVRANTAYLSCSHDQILRDRVERIIAEVGEPETAAVNTRSIPCSNCGNVTKVPDQVVSSRQIEELLKACDYNVFDPRIDEFVERHGIVADGRVKFTQTEEEESVPVVVEREPPPEKVERPVTRRRKPERDEESYRPERKLKISELGEELTRKYREKAAELESDHLQFEGILRDLFKKIDESREMFSDCNYLSAIVGSSKKESTSAREKPSLSATAPVLLSFTGSGEEMDDGYNAAIRPGVRRGKMAANTRKKLEKKELRVSCRVVSSSHPRKEPPKQETVTPARHNLLRFFHRAETLGRDSSDSEESLVRTHEKPVRDLPQRSRSLLDNKKKVPSVSRVARSKSEFPVPQVSRSAVTLPEVEEAPKERSEAPKAAKVNEATVSTHPLPEEAEVTRKEEQEAKGGTISKPPPTEEMKRTTGSVPSSRREVEEAPKEESGGGEKGTGNTESDYESDFDEESVEEDEEPMMDDSSYKFHTRLSTISEADSEMDRKMNDLAISGEEAPEGDSVKSAVPDADKPAEKSDSDDDDTRELLKKVNRDLKEVASLTARREMESKMNRRDDSMEPLKDVLDALKNQFARTELLADKLTESIKEVKSEGEGMKREVDTFRKPRNVLDAETMLKTLRNNGMRRFMPEDHTPVRRALFEGPTAQDVVADEIGRVHGIESDDEDKSYSEGEISEQEVVCGEVSSPSIGEIINEIDSNGSISEDNSVVKFL